MLVCCGASLSAGLVGCTTGNDRNELGVEAQAVRLPALVAHEQRAEEAVHAVRDATSAASLDRTHWGRLVVEAPVDGVSASPTYTRSFSRTQVTARQRGEFPTPVSALELSGDAQGQREEAWLGAPRALGGAVLLIPRLFLERPWREVRTLPHDHWRATTTERREPGAPSPTDAGRDDALAAPGSKPKPG